MMRTDDDGDVGQPASLTLPSMASPLCDFDEGFSQRNEFGVFDNKWKVGLPC